MSENVVRKENIETKSTAPSIIHSSTVNSDHNRISIIAQNNQTEPIYLELGASYNPSSTSQRGFRHDFDRTKSVTEGEGWLKESQTDKVCHSKADNTFLPLNRADTTTRSLSGYIQSHPEGIQKFTSAQRVSDPRRPLEKLHELLPDCEKIPGPSQHLQVTEWMASIDGKEEYDAFNSKINGNQLSNTQTYAKTILSGQKKQLQCEKVATISEKWQRQSTSHKIIKPGVQNPKDSSKYEELFLKF
ncbi:hypothetical protein O181_001941 [Austropuccinia psidii MF-1]|uniref:Uncharacterized protein n=1 Tax=Austropuccinia psidii MF-1 TaxID=1389203 RepID=A0A9Q3BB43_9BASI|nr:hypothetical protein [Austropuccinia psidii MF-1]